MPDHAPATAQSWVELTPDLRGYLAYPDDGKQHPAVIVFIEAYGINSHFQQLAARLAAAGYVALLPDLYHGSAYPYTDQESAIGHLRTLNDAQVMAETGAALDFLQNCAQANGAVGILGFCMGGRYAFLANAELTHRIRAAVAFYGGGIAPEQDRLGRKPLLDRIPEMQTPLLLQYGSADQSIAPEEHARIVQALSAAHKRYSMEVYPEAGHGFFCDDRVSFDAQAAAQGWKRTLDFFQQYLGDQ